MSGIRIFGLGYVVLINFVDSVVFEVEFDFLEGWIERCIGIK